MLVQKGEVMDNNFVRDIFSTAFAYPVPTLMIVGFIALLLFGFYREQEEKSRRYNAIASLPIAIAAHFSHDIYRDSGLFTIWIYAPNKTIQWNLNITKVKFKSPSETTVLELAYKVPFTGQSSLNISPLNIEWASINEIVLVDETLNEYTLYDSYNGWNKLTGMQMHNLLNPPTDKIYKIPNK